MKESILPLYAQAVEELNLQTYDRGLYGKALCDASGDEAKARFFYIKARVAYIQKTLNKVEKALAQTQQLQPSSDTNPSRLRVRRRSSVTAPSEESFTPLESIRSTFRFRRSYDSMVNLFVRWTAL